MANNTHDYTQRYFGHDCRLNLLNDKDLKILLTGWKRGIEAHDFILLPKGKDSTRYKTDEIKYYSAPLDMWKATASFAPREN